MNESKFKKIQFSLLYIADNNIFVGIFLPNYRNFDDEISKERNFKNVFLHQSYMGIYYVNTKINKLNMLAF